MSTNKIEEFFQDLQGSLSMGRLVLFGSFFISSLVLLWLTYQQKMSEGYLMTYLTTHGISFGYSKNQDVKNNIQTSQAPMVNDVKDDNMKP